MTDNDHISDMFPQYFSKQHFDQLIKVPGLDKVAFIFMATEDYKSLSVAMLGMSGKEFLGDLIFQSQKQEANEKPLPYDDFKKGMGYYAERMAYDKFDFYPCRDSGIVHDRNDFFDKFLLTVETKATLYFGIQSNDMQTIMLKGDKPSGINTPQDDDDYAYDRGTGCCAEQ